MNEINAINGIEKNYMASLSENHNKQNSSQPLSKEEIKELIHKENPEYDTESLLEEIRKINIIMDDKEVKLSYDEEIDRFIITIVDKKRNEIIQQYPCDEIQKLALHIKKMIGILYDKKV